MDTNVILNLYRYSPDTSEHILNVLNSFPKNQLWIPLQVFEEYTQNREVVITETENSLYKQFTRSNKFIFPKMQPFIFCFAAIGDF